MRDAGLLGDVTDPRGVVAVPREDADGGVEDEAALLLTCRLTVSGGALRATEPGAIERSVKARSG